MKVFNNIDVNPTDMNLYITAVTHSSYTMRILIILIMKD